MAGAGSGKTTVLVRRIAYIIRYGNAYYSDHVPEDVSEAQVSFYESALQKSKDEILNLVSSGKSDDVNVIIGSEGEYKVMDNSSVIYKPIKKNGRTVGAIGVIGPLRMDYAKVLATIEEIGENISDMLGETKQLTEGDKHAGKQ